MYHPSTNFKGQARVSRLKRIMIITLGQGTLTSWKWMGSSLWELWQEGSGCLSEGCRGSKICLECGHPVCSCVLIRRNQSRINDQNISEQCYTDNKVWFCKHTNPIIIYTNSDKQKDKQNLSKNLRFPQRPWNWARISFVVLSVSVVFKEMCIFNI